MSLWEINTLLQKSIKLIQESNLDKENKKQIVWNLENIPEVYEFDAGGFEKSEISDNFDYKKIDIYELAYHIIVEAQLKKIYYLIYDWSAFLLNYWEDYFSNLHELDILKSKYLQKIKDTFSKLNFDDYTPTHPTLTLYKDGNKWFSEKQNNLITWYCS